MGILTELNDIVNKLEEGHEDGNWDAVDEVHEELSELIYRLTDSDLLQQNFDN